MNCLKLVALDIDGVALPDTFSPVIYQLVRKWGGEYTPEIERNVFSQNRLHAATFLKNHFKLDYPPSVILEIYFNERNEYLKKNPVKPADGLSGFLDTVRSLGIKIVCYGGLDKSHFLKELDEYRSYFDGEQYICTNDFRPGVREITENIYQMDYKNILFIDDVNRVAEEARKLGAPFIGIPSPFKYGFQKADMIRTGVRYIVGNLSEISSDLLLQIDRESANGTFWRIPS